MEDSQSLKKRNPQGTLVSSLQKEMILNAYKHQIALTPDAKMVNLKKILSVELGIGMSTISQTILEYKKTNTVVSSKKRTRNRKNINNKVNDFDKYKIRRKVHQFWFDRELPTIDKILKVIKEDQDFAYLTRSSFYRLLKSMNFKYVKRSFNGAMIEKTEIILWRRKYLREIQRYREEGRPIYYLDETYINVGDVPQRVFRDKSIESAISATSEGRATGAVNPSGKKKRIIVCHIGSEDGFVPDSMLCFESKKNTQDLQDEINGECFHKWLESVLPRLKDNAVIVMDNAPYHSVTQEACPTTDTRKADIIAWLESKGEIVDPSMIIVELLEIVNKLKPMYNKYVVDEMVKTHKKEVLRLPPYHYELNPLELAWSSIKNQVGMQNNKTFKLQDVKILLTEGVQKVNSDMWKNFINHVVGEEEKLWNMDYVVDELMAERNPCVYNMSSDDSDNYL